MLWTIIFEFYVQYIFGGSIEGNDYEGLLGNATWFTGEGPDFEDFTSGYTSDVCVTLPFGYSDSLKSIIRLPLGNYLSLIATIITMVFILLLSWKLIKAIFNICAKVI